MKIYAFIYILTISLQVNKVTSNSSAWFTEETYGQMIHMIETMIERMTDLTNVDLMIEDSWLDGLLKGLEEMSQTTQTRYAFVKYSSKISWNISLLLILFFGLCSHLRT